MNRSKQAGMRIKIIIGLLVGFFRFFSRSHRGDEKKGTGWFFELCGNDPGDDKRGAQP